MLIEMHLSIVLREQIKREKTTILQSTVMHDSKGLRVSMSFGLLCEF